MNKMIDKERVSAVCPHCAKKIDLVWVCRLDSVIGTRYVFFCGECQKSLGISHEKEFVYSSVNTLVKNSANITGGCV